ncbi:N-acetyltransferase [Neobacillus piezotolerans]|uniref:N-acetyltransferase n=1 Tax=Neobacillus piezotolerans TaxID=2259171 RepID=A0A3D8GUS5_9BACI|nr:GNAT family N-acetyltransferase [Neobacillus piezotolerans]RDU38167.1 N-acetyltransferase [Neobacillus piezotolerans]
MCNITLRKFDSTDFNHYYLLVSNEQVMSMITEHSIPLEEAQEKFKKIIKRNEKYETFGSYKVYNDANEFIGLGSLILNEEIDDEAELGYMLFPQYWGKGYGSEIAAVLINKAKNTHVNRLTAIIDPKNIPSRKILLNSGFHSEKVCEIGGLPGEILSRAI